MIENTNVTYSFSELNMSESVLMDFSSRKKHIPAPL